MSDIVERLRLSVTKGHEPTDENAIEAAAEIERLRNILRFVSADPCFSVLGSVTQDEVRDELRCAAKDTAT